MLFVYCTLLFELLIGLLLIYWLFIVLFTGVVLESGLIVRGIELDFCGGSSRGESVSSSNQKLSPIRIAQNDCSQWVSTSSFWCVMELFRIKNFLIGEGKLLFGQNIFLSSPLSVKPSWLIDHVFPEVGRPFRKWANLLVIYHGSLLVFVI